MSLQHDYLQRKSDLTPTTVLPPPLTRHPRKFAKAIWSVEKRPSPSIWDDNGAWQPIGRAGS